MNVLWSPKGVGRLLSGRGIDVQLYRALKPGDATQWAGVALRVARRFPPASVTKAFSSVGQGPGSASPPTKFPGVRAALCIDAETARGARRYNDANVLCLSLRLTSEAMAHEILDAWFETNEVDWEELGSIEMVMDADRLREPERAGRGREANAGQRA